MQEHIAEHDTRLKMIILETSKTAHIQSIMYGIPQISMLPQRWML